MDFHSRVHLSSFPGLPLLSILREPAVTIQKPYPLPELRPTPIFLQVLHDGDCYFILWAIDNTGTQYRFRKYQKTNNYNEKSASVFSLTPRPQKLLLLFLVPFNKNLYNYKHTHTFFPTQTVVCYAHFSVCFFTEHSLGDLHTCPYRAVSF